VFNFHDRKLPFEAHIENSSLNISCRGEPVFGLIRHSINRISLVINSSV
jgi:hypothetical protein